jgi:transcriptional regulator with XRE-family HTH domain
MASASSLTFAELLRYHRMAAGLTQEELAERAHLSVDAISTLERGTRRTPRKENVALLADALNLAPEDRAAFAVAARRSPTATLAATPASSPTSMGTHLPLPSLSRMASSLSSLAISRVPHPCFSDLVATTMRSC